MAPDIPIIKPPTLDMTSKCGPLRRNMQGIRTGGGSRVCIADAVTQEKAQFPEVGGGGGAYSARIETAEIPDVALSLDQATWEHMVSKEGKSHTKQQHRPIVGIWNCETHGTVDLLKDVGLVEELQMLIDQDPDSSDDDDESKEDKESLAQQGLELGEVSSTLIQTKDFGYFEVFYSQHAFEEKLAREEARKVALQRQASLPMWTTLPGTLPEGAVATTPRVLSQQKVQQWVDKKDPTAPFFDVAPQPTKQLIPSSPYVMPGFLNSMAKLVCFYCGAELFDRDSPAVQHIRQTLQGLDRLQALTQASSVKCGKCGKSVPPPDDTVPTAPTSFSVSQSPFDPSLIPRLPAPFPLLHASANEQPETATTIFGQWALPTNT